MRGKEGLKEEGGNGGMIRGGRDGGREKEEGDTFVMLINLAWLFQDVGSSRLV